MARRFTDPDKWKKSWYRKLTPIEKCFWHFLLDNCDSAGIWEVDFELASFQIGATLNEEEISKKFQKQIIIFAEGKRWYLIDFIEYQQGVDIYSLNEKNNAHISIIRILKKFNIYSLIEGNLGASKGLNEGLQSPSLDPQVIVKEEVKVIVKEEIEGGMGGDEPKEPEIPEEPKEPEEQEEPEDPDTDNFIRKLYIGTLGKEPLPGDYETVKNMLKTYNYDQRLIKAAFRAGFNAKGGQLTNNYVYGILTNSEGDIKKIGNNQKSKGRSGEFGNTGNRGGGSFASRIGVTEDGDDNEFKIIKAGID